MRHQVGPVVHDIQYCMSYSETRNPASIPASAIQVAYLRARALFDHFVALYATQLELLQVSTLLLQTLKAGQARIDSLKLCPQFGACAHFKIGPRPLRHSMACNKLQPVQAF